MVVWSTVYSKLVRCAISAARPKGQVRPCVIGKKNAWQGTGCNVSGQQQLEQEQEHEQSQGQTRQKSSAQCLTD